MSVRPRTRRANPSVEHRYTQEVLDRLATHGVRPTGATSPDLVHGFLNDLYRYELRRLRDRLLRREIVKSDYHDHVVEVRRRYPLLSLRVWHWTEP
jgi:hypothetical protein